MHRRMALEQFGIMKVPPMPSSTVNMLISDDHNAMNSKDLTAMSGKRGALNSDWVEDHYKWFEYIVGNSVMCERDRCYANNEQCRKWK